MVHVQDEDDLQGAGQLGVHLVALGGQGEHHVHQVGRVAQVVAGVDDGLPCMLMMCMGLSNAHPHVAQGIARADDGTATHSTSGTSSLVKQDHTHLPWPPKHTRGYSAGHPSSDHL